MQNVMDVLGHEDPSANLLYCADLVVLSVRLDQLDALILLASHAIGTSSARGQRLRALTFAPSGL